MVVLMLALAAGTCRAAELDVQLHSAGVRQAIPSGSGLSWHAGRHFVVGDDSPYLYTLDRSFAITDRRLLQDAAVAADGRIAKDIKPDYEAMATVTWSGSVWNLVLGSGSKPGTRETGLLVATDDKLAAHVGPMRRDMAPLYRDFAALAAFNAGVAVNIEAVAVAHGTVYFFNRGNAGRNLLFEVALGDLMAYMAGTIATIAEIQLHEARLPRLQGTPAGFSGADYWPEIDSLVYCASVEASDNAYDDGAVLGSYVGLIPVSALKDRAALDLSRSAQLLTDGGAPLRTKVESIALRHTDARRAVGALVSDNDNGSSAFFDIVLTRRAAKAR